MSVKAFAKRGFGQSMFLCRAMMTPMRVTFGKINRAYFTYPIPQRLHEIVQLPLFAKEPRERMIGLWHQRFLESPTSVGGCLATAAYNQMRLNMAHCPHFVIPISLAEGSFYNLYAQCQLDSMLPTPSHDELMLDPPNASKSQRHLCLLTRLEDFKRSLGSNEKSTQAQCPPVAIISFYPDFSKEKNVVFVRGDTLASKLIDKKTLNFCWEYLRAFYSDPKLFSFWVRVFNQQPRDFDFAVFLQETVTLRQQLLISS